MGAWQNHFLNMSVRIVAIATPAIWGAVPTAVPGIPWPKKSSRKAVRRHLNPLARFNATSVPRPIQDIQSDEGNRIQLKHLEFSRVLGGGLVPGSINLIGGDPGIGKSTLLLQIALELAASQPVLYVSGEESERQIKMRADRLHRDPDGKALPLPENLLLVTETNLDAHSRPRGQHPAGAAYCRLYPDQLPPRT